MCFSYKGTAIPERIDYLMYASAPGVKMTCVNFALPFHMGRDKEGAPMSLSDHEGLYGEYLVERRHTPHHAIAKSDPPDPPQQVTNPAEKTQLTTSVKDFKSRTSYYDVSSRQQSPAAVTDSTSNPPSFLLDFFQNNPRQPDPYYTYSYEKPAIIESQPPRDRRRPYNSNNQVSVNLLQDETVTDNQEFVISSDNSDRSRHTSDFHKVIYRTDRTNSVK